MTFFNWQRFKEKRADRAWERDRLKVLDTVLQEIKSMSIENWRARQVQNSHLRWINFIRNNTKLKAHSIPKSFNSSIEHSMFIELIVKDIGKVFANNKLYSGCMVLPAELFPYPIDFCKKCFEHTINHNLFSDPEASQAIKTLLVSLNYVLDKPISEVSNDPRENVTLIEECKVF